ncbi:MAG TPA: PEP-CTERM sorting domain-containing protein [Chthoniobacterales bacterium]|nr:PEP-CTERM sorting domain-containing protein [Chthoniobacterales bacterium]
MRPQDPVFVAIALALFILFNPSPLQAETLQGQFDWSTAIQELTIPDGILTVTLTGTSTFTYDTVADMGTIFGLPEYSDPFEDTNYTFSTYFSLTNTPGGSDYALPASSFAELTTYQNVFINNGASTEPATTFWIISPGTFPGAVGPNQLPQAAFSGAYLEDGIFVLNPPFGGGTISGDGPLPTPLEGTYDNLLQIVPEPGTFWMLVSGGIVLLVARRKNFSIPAKPRRFK